MNKKILKILIIMSLFGTSVTPVLAKENVEIASNAKNVNINNYKLEKIVEKEGITFHHYKHKKSGGQVVLYSIENKSDRSIVAEHSGIYFNCFQKNNEGGTHLIEHLFSNLIEKKLNEKYTPKEMFMISRNRIFGETKRLGLGFNLNVGEWNKEIVDIFIKTLNNLNFSEELLEAEKKRMIIEMKSLEQNSPYSKLQGNFLKERMIGGLYKTGGIAEEIKKLNLPLIEKLIKKYINPSNMLLVIPKNINENYKEILKQFDEEYFSKFHASGAEKEVNTDELINKKPFREKEVDIVKYHTYRDNVEQKFKYKARVYFDLKKFSPKERDIFKIRKSDVFSKILAEEIKNLGYKIVKVNPINEFALTAYDPGAIDGLFYIDFYGNDASKFAEKALKENSKKLLDKFYEKIKKLKGKEIFELYNEGFYSMKSSKVLSYRDEERIVDFLCKSFSLTKDPFNEKFFDIENNKILDDTSGKRCIQNIEKYKENLKSIAEQGPAYIDVLKATLNKEKEEKTKEFKTYETPIKVTAKKFDLKEMIEDFIHRKFLCPKLNDTGLSYDEFFGREFVVYLPNKKAIEEYLLNNLKEDLKNYKLTEEEFKSELEKCLREKKNDLKEAKKMVKQYKEKLNDNEEIKIEAKNRKDSCLKFIKSSEIKVKELEKTINKTTDKNKLKELKKELINIKNGLKKSIKDSKMDFVKNVKLSYENTLKGYEADMNDIPKKIEEIKKITFKDFKDALNSIEIAKELKEFKNKKIIENQNK